MVLLRVSRIFVLLASICPLCLFFLHLFKIPGCEMTGALQTQLFDHMAWVMSGLNLPCCYFCPKAKAGYFVMKQKQVRSHKKKPALPAFVCLGVFRFRVGTNRPTTLSTPRARWSFERPPRTLSTTLSERGIPLVR